MLISPGTTLERPNFTNAIPQFYRLIFRWRFRPLRFAIPAKNKILYWRTQIAKLEHDSHVMRLAKRAFLANLLHVRFPQCQLEILPENVLPGRVPLRVLRY